MPGKTVRRARNRDAAQAAVAEGVDELAVRASRYFKPDRDPVFRVYLPKRPSHLKPGAILVAVAQDNSIAVRMVSEQAFPPGLEPVTTSMLMRAVDAISGLLANVHTAPAAGTQLTDAEEAVLAATDPEVGAPSTSDPVANTAVAYGALVATSLDTKAAAKRLKVNQSRVRQRVNGGAPTLYAFKHAGGWRIPEFEFDGKALIPGLEMVVPQLPHDLHPVAVFNWFTTPNTDLVDDEETISLSPRDWLRQGRSPAAVAKIAAGL